jgi:hypothetical protein
MSTCQACGASIIWIVTKGGKRMPCNAQRTVIITPAGETVSGHISHFATCPNADEFRREKDDKHGR